MFGQLVTESTLPIRKRRRPALSCVECRRRKIKCDRNQPCNHCKQTKNVTCIYKDMHPAVGNNRKSISSTASASPQKLESSLLQSGVGQSYSYEEDALKSSSSLFSSPSTAPLSETPISDHEAQKSKALLSSMTPDSVGQGPDRMRRTVEDARVQKAMGLDFTTYNSFIIQDGPERARLRTKYFSSADKTPIKDLQGTMTKARFFGNSHWMQSFGQFHNVMRFRDLAMWGDEASGHLEVKALIEKCKSIARTAKAQRPIQWHTNPNFVDYVPSRELADKLVELYLRTMESHFRIVHIPSFRQEYADFWVDIKKAPTMSVVKLLMVMAIGACFYQGDDNEAVRADAQQWVYSAQCWIAAPFEKGRLNLGGLQVQCLLLIARQMIGVGGDLLWIAAGTILRTAFQMGLHRDPKYFPKMFIMQGEIRRRLWATVLELIVQTSVDAGMPPLITSTDYDTEPPANLDDDDLLDAAFELPPAKPAHVYTQTSLQIQLTKTIRVRQTISAIVNNFKNEPAYDQILSLSAEITKACKEANILLQFYPTTSPHPTALQRNLLDLFLRRFLFALHCPFSKLSKENPQYYFSRKVILDQALIILSHDGSDVSHDGSDPSTGASPQNSQLMDDYTRLLCISGGFYREVVTHAGILVCLELMMQLEEDAASGLPPSASTKLSREPLHKVLRAQIDLTEKRIRLGDNNVKGHIFLSAAMGEIEAMCQGLPIERSIMNRARKSARTCLEILRTRTNTPESPPDAPTQSAAPAIAPPAISSDAGFVTTDTMGMDMMDYGMGVDMQYGHDFMMQDGSPDLNFDIPDSWLFSSGWQ